MSLGRRLPEVHEALLEIAQQEGWFYVHDIWTNLHAISWPEVRAANAALIKRSRYFIAWDVRLGNPVKRGRIGDEDSVSNRYFEGAAGGAVMIGSKPDFGRVRQALRLAGRGH